MPNRYIIMLIITTIGMILACRVRNCDERFRRIVINGKIRNLFLFPVAVYNQTTIFSMVVCVSYEMLIGVALFSIYLLNAKASIVCFFWGAFQIFFACVAATVECFAEWKKQEEMKEKIKYFILSICFMTASIAYLVMEICEYLEPVN